MSITTHLKHTRLPCPSPTPRACSNSCPSSQWCHPTISSSIVPFSSSSFSAHAAGRELSLRARAGPHAVFPNSTGGLTPFRPLSGLQEIPVATREDSGVLCFHSRRGVTHRVSLQKGMATHFSILTWRIPWTEEPGGPPSRDRKSTRLNSSHKHRSRMPSSA